MWMAVSRPVMEVHPSPSMVKAMRGSLFTGNNGFGGGIALSPNSIVIDGSGDVWVASATFQPGSGRGVPGVYTWRITELVGIAAPVVTPLAAGVKNNALGSRP